MNLKTNTDEQKHFGNAKLSPTDLISLHSTFYSHFESRSQQITTYLSIFISAIFITLSGSIVAINININIIVKSILLCLCGGLSFILSISMLKIYTREYNHILDSIAKIVIIEGLLDLNNVEVFSCSDWLNDSLVMKHHIMAREETKTIKGFKEVTLQRKGNQRSNVKLLSIYFCLFSTAPIIYAIVIFICEIIGG